MANVQFWEDWTDEAVAEQEQRISKGMGGEFLRLKPGDSYFRFLPPLKGSGQKSPFREVWQHFLGGSGDDLKIPGRDRAMVFECPKLAHDEVCDICERAEELAQARDAESRELARRLSPSLRFFANVIDMENPDAGPQILPFGKSIYDQLIAIKSNPKTGGNFTHPETGFTIVINRVGTGRNDTRYNVQAARDTEELEDFDWIKEQHDLGSLVRPPTDEDMLLAVTAIDAVMGDTESAAALPKQRPKRRRRSLPDRKTRRADTDEEESPRRKKVRKKRKKKVRKKADGAGERTKRARRGFSPKTTAQSAIDDDEEY